MSKTATCLWCGEEIEKIGDTWRHTGTSDTYRHVFCYCHCVECDPDLGCTANRICIDGEAAVPDFGKGEQAERKICPTI